MNVVALLGWVSLGLNGQVIYLAFKDEDWLM